MGAEDTLSSTGVSSGSPQGEVEHIRTQGKVRWRSQLLIDAELLIVGLWTMFVTRPYLHLDP